jgi:putative holliday junction resolvase
VLGLDVGTRRIGAALSDPTGTIATPLATISHQSARRDMDRIAELCSAHGVDRIVVGYPRNMDGTSGPAARRARAFAEALRRRVPIPVEEWDERLSTVEADRALIHAGVRRMERREVRDRVAAGFILQGYLDARRNAAE